MCCVIAIEVCCVEQKESRRERGPPRQFRKVEADLEEELAVVPGVDSIGVGVLSVGKSVGRWKGILESWKCEDAAACLRAVKQRRE